MTIGGNGPVIETGLGADVAVLSCSPCLRGQREGAAVTETDCGSVEPAPGRTLEPGPSSQLTLCWREVDSNHRSPPEIVRPSERFVQRSLGRSTDVFRRDREFDVSAVQGRLSTSSPGQCSTEPGLIAETWLWTTFPDAGPVVRIHFPPARSQQRTVHVKTDSAAAQADGQQQLGKAMPVAKEEAGGREEQRITGLRGRTL